MEKIISFEEFDSLFEITYEVLDKEKIEIKLIPNIRIIKFIDLERFKTEINKQKDSNYTADLIVEKMFKEEAYKAFLTQIEKLRHEDIIDTNKK